jgi:hypothetical protein
LNAFIEDGFTEEQVDVEILVLTLSGIINSDQSHLAKAKQLSTENSNWSDRRKWLIIPKMTI